MSILNNIDRQLEHYMENGGVPECIILGVNAARAIEEIIGDKPKTVRGFPVRISKEIEPDTVLLYSSDEEDTLRTECPKCGYMSYLNGYCKGCGRYRKGHDDREIEPDLCDLIGDDDEALRYGFSIVEEE